MFLQIHFKKCNLKYLLINKAFPGFLVTQAFIVQSAKHHVHNKEDRPRYIPSLSRNSGDSMENPADIISIVGMITTSFTRDTVHIFLLYNTETLPKSQAQEM